MGGGVLEEAERVRVQALSGLDRGEQDRLGQFFTPHLAAELVAAMPRLPHGDSVIRVLDPGAGSGMLMAAVINRVINEQPGRPLHVTAVEVDESLLPALEETAGLCQKYAAERGTEVSVDIRREDLLDSVAGMFAQDLLGSYDLVIMNPPYAKMSATSSYRRALSLSGVDCPNLYAAFVVIGLRHLSHLGQLVAITPRSFANGPYFEQFRKFLLATLTLDRVHTFESRSTVFSDTGVLQENIMFSGTKNGQADSVRFTVSRGHTDEASEHVVNYDEVVRPDDPHQFLWITAGRDDQSDARIMSAMSCGLLDLGLKVSTGRVVDFRSKGNLRAVPDEGNLPLIYPVNLRGGVIEWPQVTKKAQGYAILNDQDRKLLMPSGYYVVIKRFSAKEERRRIVAAVWDPVYNGDIDVAFENHLNVIHDAGRGLGRAVAIGLSIWLNSSVVDRYFRTFSGHTQVNATDLRALRYPPLDVLHELGSRGQTRLDAQDELDKWVEKIVLPEVAA
ncbi:Eco57I restriction-modification methylase domain-containing protein [Actinokineospora terrae]|nr:Eco57I restriction-modification methylase domain-containing protein [Actinokineospora terrae]